MKCTQRKIAWWLSLIALLLCACGDRSVDRPSISSVEPLEAQVKSVIVIRGSNFIDSYSQTFVRFEGKSADPKDFVSITNNEIQVRVPTLSKTGNLYLEIQDETTNSVPFTVFGPWIYVVHGGDFPGLSVLDSHIPEDGTGLDVRAETALDMKPGTMATTLEGDKAYLTLPSTDSVLVLDAPKNSIIGTIVEGIGPNPSALAFTELDKHKCFIANRGDRSVTVVDTLTNTVIDTLVPAADGDSRTDWGQASVVVDPVFETVYVIFEDEAVLRAYWVDSHELRSETLLGDGIRPTQLLVLPNNLRVYCLTQGNTLEGDDVTGSLISFDIGDQAILRTTLVGQGPTEMANVANSYLVVANNTSDSVTILNTDGDVVDKTFFIEDVGEEPFGVTVSDENDRIFVSSTVGGKITVINRSDLVVEDTITLSQGIEQVIYRETGEGERLFVLNPLENSIAAVNVDEDDDTGDAPNTVIASTQLASDVEFMYVERLDTYPPTD